MDKIQDALAQVMSRLRSFEFWSEEATGRGWGSHGLHLAILVEPYLRLLLAGEKTVESRFSCVKCAPYGRVHPGDTVLVKRSGGQVLGAFRVGAVWSYEIDENSWHEIRGQFSEAICPQGSEFWNERSRARYATLIKVQNAVSFAGVDWPKKDRRGWVVLSEASGLELLL